MARRYRTLSAAEQREFDSASEADLRASRWYGWVQIAGAAIAAAYFVLFLAPATLHIVRWVAAGMSRSAPTGAEYWYVLISGCVAVIPVAIPLLLYIRERRTRQFTALLRSSA
jgi:hypothetical protein